MGSPSRKKTMNNPGTAGRLGQAIQEIFGKFSRFIQVEKMDVRFRIYTP